MWKEKNGYQSQEVQNSNWANSIRFHNLVIILCGSRLCPLGLVLYSKNHYSFFIKDSMYFQLNISCLCNLKVHSFFELPLSLFFSVHIVSISTDFSFLRNLWFSLVYIWGFLCQKTGYFGDEVIHERSTICPLLKSLRESIIPCPVFPRAPCVNEHTKVLILPKH